jgi:hypothetical protein
MSMILTEHGFEPVRGLPEQLPPGESLLWQGAPTWRAFARHALKLRWIGCYFAALAAWRAGMLLSDGAGAMEAAAGAAVVMAVGLVPVALLAIYAALVARSTVYSLTTKRLVLRVGVALPFSINLPFSAIQSAGLRLHADGSGDILLRLASPHRVAWLMLWPHARPWAFRDPAPLLRCIAEPEKVAQLLGRALGAAAGQSVTVAPHAVEPGRAGAPATAVA